MTEPASSSALTPAKPPPAAARPTPTPTLAPPTPTPAPAPEAQQEQSVAASHILIAYAGATRADPALKRTKDEARKRADGILARARKGEDFPKLADLSSDDPSAQRNHAPLRLFTRVPVGKPVAAAALSL